MTCHERRGPALGLFAFCLSCKCTNNSKRALQILEPELDRREPGAESFWEQRKGLGETAAGWKIHPCIHTSHTWWLFRYTPSQAISSSFLTSHNFSTLLFHTLIFFFFSFPSRTCFESPLFYFLSFCRSCRCLLPVSLFPCPHHPAVLFVISLLSSPSRHCGLPTAVTKWKPEVSFLHPRKFPLQGNCTEDKHLLWAAALNHCTLCCKQCSVSHQPCRAQRNWWVCRAPAQQLEFIWRVYYLEMWFTRKMRKKGRGKGEKKKKKLFL